MRIFTGVPGTPAALLFISSSLPLVAGATRFSSGLHREHGIIFLGWCLHAPGLFYGNAQHGENPHLKALYTPPRGTIGVCYTV